MIKFIIRGRRMGQREIYEYIRQYPDVWFTVKQLAKILNVLASSINNAVARMKNYPDVVTKLRIKSEQGGGNKKERIICYTGN